MSTRLLLLILVVATTGCRSAPIPTGSNHPLGKWAWMQRPDSQASAIPATKNVGSDESHIGLIAFQEPDPESEIEHLSQDTDKRSGSEYHGLEDDDSEGIVKNVEEKFQPPDESSVDIFDAQPGENTTLQELEQWAINVHPAIQKLAADLEALRGKHTQVGLAPNPKVGFNGEDIGQDGGAGRFGVFYGREVVYGNKLELSRSVVCAEIAVAEQRLLEMQQRLLTDVRLRYYELLVVQKKVELVDKLVVLSRKAKSTSEKLLEAEEIARAVVVQSQLELQNALLIKAQARNEFESARRKLAALIAAEQLPFEIASGNLEDARVALEFETTFDELLANSPELAVLKTDVERARRKVARQRAEPISNITWQAGLQYDTVGDSFVTGFQVGMPLPVCDQNQGAIHQAEFEWVSAQRKTETKVLELRNRLANAFQDYQSAKTQIEAFDGQLLPLAKESLELLTLGYEQGEINFLQLLTAQRTYFQTNIDYINMLRQSWQQSVKIKGMLLEGSLE